MSHEREPFPVSSPFGPQRRLGLLILFAALLMAVWYAHRQGLVDIHSLARAVRASGSAAPDVFMAIYAGSAVLLLPTGPLNLAAGFFWGAAWGCAYSVTGATVGAVVSFALSRYLLRQSVNGWFRGNRWRTMRDEISRYGWRSVGLARINPVVPFGPVNYLFGITTLRFREYFWPTLLFLIPPSLIVASIGASASAAVGDASADRMLKDLISISLGLTILVLAWIAFARLRHRRVGRTASVDDGDL